MNDIGLLSILLGFPPAVGTLVVLLLLAQWWIGMTVCPGCGRRTPKTAVNAEGNACWYCEAPARRRIALEPGCHKCGSPLTTDERIHLWDGHDYCRTCVETKSPRLARYAAEHTVFEETMPHSAWRIAWQNFVFYWGGVMALFGTMAFFAGLENDGIRGGLQGLLVVQLWILPVVVTFSFGIAISFSLSRPTVTVREGEITVRTGCHWSSTCRLTDVAWFRGRSMQTKFLGRYLLPGGPRVLIVLPRGDEREDRLVPVGFSEFTRDVWTAFLTLADNPHQTAFEQKRPLAATVADTFSFIMILVGSFVGMFYAGRLAGWIAFNLTQNADVARIIRFVCVFPGFIFAIGYGLILWPWAGSKRIPTKRTPKAQADMQLELTVRLGVIGGFFSTIPFLFVGQIAPATRLIGVFVAGTLSLALAYDLARRSAAWEQVPRGTVPPIDPLAGG